MSKRGKHVAKKTTKNGKKNKNTKRISWKKVLITFITLLVLIAGIVCGYIFNKLGRIDYTDLSNEDLGISENIKEGYRNIALFAVDTRNVKSNQGSRSDGIIILSINEETKDVRLVSVYRDTYAEVEGHGFTKITHAYAYGGPSLAIRTLNKNLDLNISEFATVNFESVADAIDLMGGIEVTITSEELPQMNKYIKETSSITGIQANTLPSAGTYNLNGVQAVTYGRIRKISGGDYKRTERMRTVIMKAFEKAKQMDIGTLNKVIDTVLPEVQTNITSTEILALAAQISSYNISGNMGWPYETKGKTLDAWYGIPVTLETNVQRLHQELFEDPEYVVPETVKQISDSIVQKTGYTAPATSVTQ